MNSYPGCPTIPWRRARNVLPPSVTGVEWKNLVLGMGPPSPNDRRRVDFGGGKVDRGQFFYFYLPSMSRVEIIVLPTGTERTEENMCKGLRTYSYKFLTAESESATHFFWLHIRNYLVGDQEAAAKLRAALEQTFREDLEIEVAMQRSQDETGIRQLIALDLDRAPVMAVRMLQRMIEAENPSLTA